MSVSMKKRICGSTLAVLSLTGCGMLTDNAVYGPDGIIRDRSQDYQDARQHQTLVIPPHLRAKDLPDPLAIPKIGETATEQNTQNYKVPRPEFFYAESGSDHVNLVRDKAASKPGEKLIVVDEPISDVWVKVQEFWRFNGVDIAKSDPQTGVMETAWVERAGTEPGLVDRWLSALSFSDATGPLHDRLRIELRPDPADANRTAIRMRHVQLPVNGDVAAINWDKQARDVGYKTDMMFEMLRYLSKATGGRDATSLVALRDKVKVSSQLGRDARGNPVLRLDGSIDAVWQKLSAGLDKAGMDVGTRDQKKGIFYLTYTTSTPFEEVQEQSFLEWLHSDRGEIKLDTSFLDRALSGSEGQAVGPDGIRYSAKTVEQKLAELKNSPDATAETGLLPPEENVLAEKEGFKIWFGGKVVYVFGDNNAAGVYNENTGKYEHVGRYQLQLKRTRSGVYLIVTTDQGLVAPAIVSEEMLWKIKEALPAKA
ncbi:MAG: outer membrane protein assembly factor BamC [Marinobacterium sp.]|nr:outer membrane protein assembly factor BamC [Marinobacterium sp.]